MIRLSEDAVEVRGLLERIGGADITDLSGYEGRWHAWIWGGGLFLIIPVEELVSEVHVYVFPYARGLHAVRAAREVARVENEQGVRLVGRTPLENRPARMFAAMAGGRVIGVEDNEEVREWAR
jgi:hypothetical protein